MTQLSFFQAEEIFAYISPDAPEWRSVLREKIRGLVIKYGMDTIFLDQLGTFINDRRYDHFRGLRTLYAELRADLPKVQFTGESPTTELSLSISPLLSGRTSGGGGKFVPEMYRRLFGPYVREHGHSASMPPEPYPSIWGGAEVRTVDWWSKERFLEEQERAAQIGAIPTLSITDQRIDLSGELVQVVLARARTYEGAIVT